MVEPSKRISVFFEWFRDLPSSRKTGALVVTLFFLALAPYMYAKGPSIDVGRISALTTRIGELLGLYGFLLFSTTLVLAGRWKFVVETFRSLKEMYSVHKDIGEFTLIVLLLHPLVMSIRYMMLSVDSAAKFLLFDLNYIYGQTALLALILGIIGTIYVDIPYDKWKYIMKIMGAVFLFGFIHAFTVESDIFYSSALNIYFLIFALAAIGSFVRRSVLGKYLVPREKYRVEQVDQLNSEMVEIFLKPEDTEIDYNPGDVAFFTFSGKGIPSESHPFSIVHSSGEGFSIIVKSVGDFTSELKESVTEGVEVKVEGPYDDISFEGKDQVWLAGGSGIPPFLSKLKTLSEDDKVHLYYSVLEKFEAVHLEELRDKEEELDGFSYTLHISSKDGYITADDLDELDADSFTICGPPSMMENLQNQLQKKGIKPEKIRAEEFDLR